MCIFLEKNTFLTTSAQQVPEPDLLPVFFSIPDPTRFSFNNQLVEGNPKYWVLSNVSDQPKVFGIT